MTMKWQRDTEYLELIKDLIEHEDVKNLEKFVHHKVTNRLAHSISVSYSSFCWARRLNLNTRAIARAGLLHDLFFYESETKNEVGGRGHNYEHPRIALENALKITNLSDLEQDIILKHMAGTTRDIPKYPESLIVTLMDKQCAIVECAGGVKNFLAKKINETKDYALQLVAMQHNYQSYLTYQGVDERDI